MTRIVSKRWASLTVLGVFISTQAFATPIEWGVNVHNGGSDPKNVAEKLSERNLKSVRMDLWGNDSRYLAKFRNAAECFAAKKIKIEAVVYTVFSGGQPRSQDYDADLKEVEKTAYDATKSQIGKPRTSSWTSSSRTKSRSTRTSRSPDLRVGTPRISTRRPLGSRPPTFAGCPRRSTT